MGNVLLSSSSGNNVNPICKRYADQAHNLMSVGSSGSSSSSSSSSSVTAKKARHSDYQESPEVCLNCDKPGVSFDPLQPFVSTCVHCNSVYDRCCLSLRLVNFDLSVYKCQMCCSVCVSDNDVGDDDDGHFFHWLPSTSRLCPFCLVVMDSL